jgi:hypothetical protein
VSHSRGTLGPRLLDHGVVIRARLWTGHKAPCQLELDLLFVSALVLVKQFRNMIDSAPGATLQSGCAVGRAGYALPDVSAARTGELRVRVRPRPRL